jgi:parvulin-like peptidyl-prolyl isomerase
MMRCLVARAALAMFLLSVAACERPPVPKANGEAAAAPTAAAPAELPAVVARVNGEAVERWEIESALKEIELLAVHPVPRSERDALVRNVVERIVGHYLVAQEARKQRLDVSASDVEADIAQIRQEYAAPGAFDRMLAHFGLSLEQLQRQRRLRLEVARFVRSNVGPIDIPAGDVDAYYRENSQQFQEPETAIASHILVAVLPTATPEEKLAARARAAAVLERLRRGEEFGAVAREESQDSESAAGGGRLEPIRRGETDPPFEAAVFATAPGALSDVVETPLGYHVIRTHELRAPRVRPLAEVRTEIEQLLAQRAQQARLDELIEKIRAKSAIEIYI